MPRTVHFYNWLIGTGMTFWGGLLLVLVLLSEYASPTAGAVMSREWAGRGAAFEELAACRRLGQVRMKEYQALEPKLKKDLEAAVSPSTEAVVAAESSLSLSL